jgi:hypothetical protein
MVQAEAGLERPVAPERLCGVQLAVAGSMSQVARALQENAECVLRLFLSELA